MWKCKKCGNIESGGKFVRDGYCSLCDEYFLMERYDPFLEKTKEKEKKKEKKEPKKPKEKKEKEKKPRFSDIQYRLLRFLKENGDSHRKRLINSMNLARTTAYDNLEILEEQGLLKRYSKASNGKRGRPPTIWSYIGDGTILKRLEPIYEE